MTVLLVREGGELVGVCSDSIDYAALADGLGRVEIRRASHVEPTVDGRWSADMGPVSGPVLGPFATRREALDAERSWLALKGWS